jgi:hypothetical protein
VVFDDPIIHRVVDDMGGWCSFGVKDGKELPFVEKEFVARYRAFKSKGVLPAYNRKLVGLDEARNVLDGFEPMNRPVYIGSPDRAKLVYEQKLIG